MTQGSRCSPLQIQDNISAERETKGRKRSFADREGTTEIEVAHAMVRKTAILLEHAAIDYGGDGGTCLFRQRNQGTQGWIQGWFERIQGWIQRIQGWIQGWFEGIHELKDGLKDLKDAMIARYSQI